MTDDEPYDEEEFADCPAGKPVDEFHDRILSGLTASLDALEERRRRIAHLPPDRRDDAQRAFLSLYDAATERLARVENRELPYDQRFKLAQEVQGYLSEMDLLIP